MRAGWEKRQKMLKLQETCCYEWQNLIAEASRKGLSGQEELQWNSYKILNRQLEKHWMQSVEQRKTRRQKGNKRAPKSAEQRRKIAEAIAAKWADPVRANASLRIAGLDSYIVCFFFLICVIIHTLLDIDI